MYKYILIFLPNEDLNIKILDIRENPDIWQTYFALVKKYDLK